MYLHDKMLSHTEGTFYFLEQKPFWTVLTEIDHHFGP